MSSINVAQFTQSVNPAVQKYFVATWEPAETRMSRIAKIGKQSVFNQTEQQLAGLGDLPLVPEKSAYGTDAPLETYSTVYTPAKYGNVTEITEEMIRYNRIGLADGKKIGEMQAKSVSRAVEKEFMSMFNNGFNTSFTSYGDNKPLFSVSHTRADGGTAQVNASSTSIPLNEANLHTLTLLVENALDDRGQEIMVYADSLLVPTELKKKATEILKSELRSGTGDNDLNAYMLEEIKGLSMPNLFISKYLTSTTAWFVFDSVNHLLTWNWGVKPFTALSESAVGFLNDTRHFKYGYEASKGWSDWRGLGGSKGDSTAYAS